MTEGACISILCECNMCPLCSSIRATPLKIITTARRSVHTLIGSNEAFSTKTRAFILEAILREPKGQCQKLVSRTLIQVMDRAPVCFHRGRGLFACGSHESQMYCDF